MNIDQIFTTGSVMLTLYVIAVVLIYAVFIRQPRKSK